MARQAIGVGTTANDGTGDPLRDALIKVNNMTTELYTALGDGSSIQFNTYTIRNSINAAAAAALDNGTVVTIDSLLYLVDNTATGSDSATNDLSVDGLLPFGDIFYEHFGARGDGVTDDTAAMNAAIDYYRNLIDTGTDRDNSAVLRGRSNAIYVISGTGLNMTGFGSVGATFDFTGTRINAATSGEAVVDMLDSRWCVVRNLYITTTGTCKSGVMIGRKDSGSADRHTFENLRIYGDFSVACLTNYRSEQNVFIQAELINNAAIADSRALIVDGNDTSYTSDHVSVAGVSGTTNENRFLGGSFIHRADLQGDAVYITGCQKLEMHKSFVAARHTAAIVIDLDGSASCAALDLDVHIESFLGGAGIDYCFEFRGTGNVVLDGFRYRDHRHHADLAVFYRNGPSTITITDFRVEIFDAVDTGTPIFDSVAEWKLEGQLLCSGNAVIDTDIKLAGHMRDDTTVINRFGPLSLVDTMAFSSDDDVAQFFAPTGAKGITISNALRPRISFGDELDANRASIDYNVDADLLTIQWEDGTQAMVIRDSYFGPSTGTANTQDLARGSFRFNDGYFAGRLYHSATGSNTISISGGTGSPESVVTAAQGSLYTRTDGGAGTTLYVKESGTGNTGWVAK